MPAKTKKEKLLAQDRRNEMFSLPQISFRQHSIAQDTSLPLIRHDLVKTVLIGFFAIGTEFFLYWFEKALF